jgi:cysteine desulfurase
MKKRIYLDSAAAHPVRPLAQKAFVHALKAYGNPSAPHEEGREALALLEDARTAIARECGAKSDAVIFTSGATESNALAIIGHLQARIEAGAKAEDLEVLYSPTQHASVIGAVEEARALGVRTQEIPLQGFGIDVPALSAMVSRTTTLITLDVVCSETGTRFDTRAVRKIIDALPYDARPVFHVDATQAPLTEHLDRTRLGADLITFDAQKIGGVRGIGVLIAPRSIALSALSRGGGQERGLRGGTPSPALARACAVALCEASKKREAFVKKSARLTQYVRDEVERTLSQAVVNAGEEQAPNILNISFVGRDSDYLVALLNEAGFAVATKSACETDAVGSRAVTAFTHDDARATSTLRISLYDGITEKDTKAFVRALTSAVAFVDGAH